MKIRTAVIAGAAVVILAGVPVVRAQMHHREAFVRQGGPLLSLLSGKWAARFQEALGLTDDQIEQLQAIGKDVVAQNAPYRQQLETARLAAAAALLANPDDVAGAQALLDAQDGSRKAIETNTLGGISRALKVLTPEQRVKLAGFIASHARIHDAIHAGEGTGR